MTDKRPYWPHSDPEPRSENPVSGSRECVICQHRTEDMACARCLSRLDEALEDIVTLYALLPSVMEPGSVQLDDMPHGKRTDAPAPVRLDVLALTDSRSTWAQRRGEIPSVLSVLSGWSRIVIEDCNLSIPTEATVTTEAGLLRTHLQWIGKQAWVDDMWKEIRMVRSNLKDVCGEPLPKPIGTCPAEVIEEGQVVTCGALLYAPTYGDTVRCRDCNTTWSRDTWLLLGRLITEGEAS